MKRRYEAWISDGAGRRRLYTGSSVERAREACYVAIEVISLMQLTARVYVRELGRNREEMGGDFDREYEGGIAKPEFIQLGAQ